MSSQPCTVFITGANRGIGRALVEAYLARPNHSVIASVRNPESTTLKDITPAAGSRLLIVKIEAKSAGDPAAAVEQVKAAGITALDIVIAVKDIDTEQMAEILQVNTFAFVTLFSAVHPLLKAAAADDHDSAWPGPPKLLAISSNASQIVDMAPTIPVRVGAYGASKAALNYLVRRAHFENPWLACWVMNPGFVRTEPGNEAARLFGMDGAPDALEDIVPALMRTVDEATVEKTSGNFYNFDGAEMTY
ncbi:aflatoxin biosynthesis ketoreductase nor-1 [Apiospora hydei]|uniref:Aflatoxin biosynthesis ketoreductase nor-1 n=1 Tax=Apiospora hydei TaxID=1337664 RepID=A0ABR1WXA8_9PEZI